MALQEPKKLLRNHDFQSSVTGISDKIDTSLILLIWFKFIYISFFTVNAMIFFEGGLLFWGGGAVRPHSSHIPKTTTGRDFVTGVTVDG